MAIVAFEALLALDRELSMSDAARFVRDLIEHHQPAADPLVPLPYAGKFWRQANPAMVSSAPVLGLKSDVEARGDSAWPISIQSLNAAGRTAIILSVDIKPPFGSIAEGWLWFRDWVAALVTSGEVSYALINGSSNEDEPAKGEGLPRLKLLDDAVPAAVAPWFFIGSERVVRASEGSAAALRQLAEAELGSGLVFTPSPDFGKSIPRTFIKRFEAAAGKAVEIFQGRLA